MEKQETGKVHTTKHDTSFTPGPPAIFSLLDMFCKKCEIEHCWCPKVEKLYLASASTFGCRLFFINFCKQFSYTQTLISFPFCQNIKILGLETFSHVAFRDDGSLQKAMDTRPSWVPRILIREVAAIDFLGNSILLIPRSPSLR